MNTFLSSAQEALKEQFRAFAKEHVSAIADSLEERTADMSALFKEMGQAGYLGQAMSKEHGGAGGSFLSTVLFVEAVAEYDAGLGLSLAGHLALMELVSKFGSDAQKRKFLKPLIAGEIVGAVAVSEPDAGTDFESVTTKIELDGANGKLTGSKSWVVNGDIAQVIAVLANGKDGLSFWLIDTSESKVKVGPAKNKLGLRSAHTNDIEFEALQLTADHALRSSSDATELMHFQSNVAKTIVAATAVGMIEGALEGSLEHARTRHQFGKPISQYQAIQWKIADMSAESAAARLLTYRAACSKDDGSEEFSRDAAMCKYFASKVARVHSSEFVQILGSFGIADDSHAEKVYRDAKVTEIAEGTSEAQKLILVKQLGI